MLKILKMVSPSLFISYSDSKLNKYFQFDENEILEKSHAEAQHCVESRIV